MCSTLSRCRAGRVTTVAVIGAPSPMLAQLERPRGARQWSVARGKTAPFGLKLLLEYGYGKPQQHVDVSSGSHSLIRVIHEDDLKLLDPYYERKYR